MAGLQDIVKCKKVNISGQLTQILPGFILGDLQPCSLKSVYRDTLESVNRYVSWPPDIGAPHAPVGAPRCTSQSRQP